MVAHSSRVLRPEIQAQNVSATAFKNHSRLLEPARASQSSFGGVSSLLNHTENTVNTPTVAITSCRKSRAATRRKPTPEIDPSYFESSDSDGTGEQNNRHNEVQPDEVDVRGGEYEQHLGSLPKTLCPFGRTVTWGALYNSNEAPVYAEILAEFTKKFLDESTAHEPHHATYRRNYCGVKTHFRIIPPTNPMNGFLFVVGEDKLYRRVKHLVVRLRAVKNHEAGESVEIVSHNAKREILDPNESKLEQIMQPHMVEHDHVYDESTGFGSDRLKSPINHSFLRLQFRKATESNGYRKKDQNYHRIVVDLLAVFDRPTGQRTNAGREIFEEAYCKIASTMSGRIVVFGRGPSSHEPYDPNNRRRKPRKTPKARGGHVAYRPTGIVKNKTFTRKSKRVDQAARAPGNQQIRRRCFSGAINVSTPGLTRDSPSAATTPGSEGVTSLMIPQNEMPPGLRLPVPSRSPGLFSIPEYPEFSMHNDQLGSYQGLDFYEGYSDPYTQIFTAAYNPHGTSNPAFHGFDCNQAESHSHANKSENGNFGYHDGRPWF